MRKKRQKCSILLLAATSLSLFGAAGRPKDGFLFFVVILGFLGMILGIIYLVEYIRKLIQRFLDEYFNFL